MTDHELNEKMALLCGRTLFLAPACEQLYVEPIESAEELLCGFASGRTAVLWDPVDDWRQVQKCVIPALNDMGFDVAYARQATGGCAIRITHGDDVVQLEGRPDDLTPTRAICEAALEAWKELEKRHD